MKICFFIDSMAPAAGIERVISILGGLWVDSGYEVTILRKDDNQSFYQLHKNIHLETMNYVPKKIAKSKVKKAINIAYEIIRLRNSLREKIENIKPDYIYCATAANAFLAYYALRKRHRIIAGEHGVYDASHLVYKILKRTIYPKIYAVIALTKADLQRYLKINKNSFYVPNPLPLNFGKKSDLKNKQVIAVGRFVPEKGYDYMLNAWALVTRKHPDWKLKIFGEGYLKEAIQKIIDKENLRDSVFLEGLSDNITEEYTKSSIFLMSSKNEGWSMAMLEAMACGLPVVSFNTPAGPREILGDYYGLTAECYNIEDLALNLCRMMKDESLRSVYSDRSIKRALDYRAEIIIDIWNNIFNQD